MHDPEIARAAARNNAEWCDLFCRSHGIPGTFHVDMWSSAHRTPPFYPDAVTLDVKVTPDRILSHIDTLSPGCSIKDSFATLDLSESGFKILFTAQWIYRPAGAALSDHGNGARWTRVSDADLLARWEAAWTEDGPSAGMFRPEILDDEAVIVLAAMVGGRVIGGAILNRSESVVGLSNLFTPLDDLRPAWTDCLRAAAEYMPGLPIVGYQRGPMLQAAQNVGFTSVGPLRIWIAATD